MKKIFTLIALAAFAFNMNAGTPKSAYNDDQVFTMSILDASKKDNVVIEVGAQNLRDDIALVSFRAYPPAGAAFVEDADEFAPIVCDDSYAEDWAIPKFATATADVNAVIKDDGSVLAFLSHKHKSYRVFKAGDVKFGKIFLDASGLNRGEGEGPNGARFYATIPGNNEEQVIFSAITDADDIDYTYVPQTEVKLMIGVAEDGSITGIESVRTNSEAKKGIYNLMGQKVNEMQAGQIYIVDGKKVMK